MFNGGRDQRLVVVFRADVAGNGNRITAGSPDFGNQAIEFGLAAARQA